MRLSGTDDLEIELLPDNTVRLSLRFKTPYEAGIAYQDIKDRCAKGELKITLGLGPFLEGAPDQ